MAFRKQHKFDNYSTVIGENTILVSEILKGEGSVRIDGKYKGDILLDSDLTVGEKGVIEGSVQANNIEISGVVIGNVSSNDLLHLTSNANVKGDISCNTLIVDHGASISGYCTSGNSSDHTNVLKFSEDHVKAVEN